MKTKNNILKKISIPFLIIALVHFGITWITDRFFFRFVDGFRMEWDMTYSAYLITKSVCFVVLILFWQLIAKLVKKDERLLKYFKAFLAAIIPLIIVAIVLYPIGSFGVDDEVFSLMTESSMYGFNLYFVFLTSMYYMLSYMLIPTTLSPVIILILVNAGIISYLAVNLKEIFKSKWAYICLFPFYTCYNFYFIFYPHRSILCGTLLFIAMALLLVDYLKKNKISLGKIFVLAIATALCSIWRDEYFYLFLLIPFLILIVYKPRFKEMVRYILITAFFSTACLFVQSDGFREENVRTCRNSGTIIISLISDHSDPTWIDDPHATGIMDLYIKYEDLLHHYGDFTYSIFYPYSWRGEYEYCDAFFKAGIDLMLKNYKTVLVNRFRLYSEVLLNTGYNVEYNDLFASKVNPVDYYIVNGHVYFPLVNIKLRKFVVGIIESKTKSKFFNSFNSFLNSTLIPVCLMLVIFFVALFKKKWVYFFIAGGVLAHQVLLFICIPLSLPMYSYADFLIGYFTGIVFFYEWGSSLNIKKS